MVITISGVGPYTFKILPEFEPKINMAVSFFRLANGDYAATDRGSSEDTYETNISLYGTEADIYNFIYTINLNRTLGYNTVSLSDFNTQEYIFGADIDYSGSISARIYLDDRVQNTFKGFSVSAKLIGISLPLIDMDPAPTSLPSLRYLDIGYNANTRYTLNTLDSYSGDVFYQDKLYDSGKFTGVYTFDHYEMMVARRVYTTKRGTSFNIPSIIGVTHPFGIRPISGKKVRLTEFEDLGMYSMDSSYPIWKAKITLSEAFS